MKTHVAVIAAVAAILTACGGGSTEAGGTDPTSGSAATAPRCYELVEGASRAVIKVEGAPNAVDPQGGQVTIYSFLGDAEEFPPETTAGRLEANAFVYADGTRLLLTESSLTWPQDSLLEGAVFTSTTCP